MRVVSENLSDVSGVVPTKKSVCPPIRRIRPVIGTSARGQFARSTDADVIPARVERMPRAESVATGGTFVGKGTTRV